MSEPEVVGMRAKRIVNVVAVASRLVPACLVFALSAGCQERPTTVSGTITLDGRPLAVGADARGTVTFHPANGQGTMSIGLIDSTGHFNLATGGSRVVAPGKYDVSVSVIRLLPKVDAVEQGTELVTPAKYVQAHESGLQAEVTPATENQLSFNLVSSAGDESNDASEQFADTPQTPDSQPATESPDSNAESK